MREDGRESSPSLDSNALKLNWNQLGLIGVN